MGGLLPTAKEWCLFVRNMTFSSDSSGLPAHSRSTSLDAEALRLAGPVRRCWAGADEAVIAWNKGDDFARARDDDDPLRAHGGGDDEIDDGLLWVPSVGDKADNSCLAGPLSSVAHASSPDGNFVWASEGDPAEADLADFDDAKDASCVHVLKLPKCEDSRTPGDAESSDEEAPLRANDTLRVLLLKLL